MYIILFNFHSIPVKCVLLFSLLYRHVNRWQELRYHQWNRSVHLANRDKIWALCLDIGRTLQCWLRIMAVVPDSSYSGCAVPHLPRNYCICFIYLEACRRGNGVQAHTDFLFKRRVCQDLWRATQQITPPFYTTIRILSVFTKNCVTSTEKIASCPHKPTENSCMHLGLSSSC